MENGNNKVFCYLNFLPLRAIKTKKKNKIKHVFLIKFNNHKSKTVQNYSFQTILQVSWVRHRDIHLLTVGRYTYTSDQRFRAIHHPHSEDWILQIKYPQHRDSGIYECQVSTTPHMSHYIHLNVIGESCFWMLNFYCCKYWTHGFTFILHNITFSTVFICMYILCLSLFFYIYVFYHIHTSM